MSNETNNKPIVFYEVNGEFFDDYKNAEAHYRSLNAYKTDFYTPEIMEITYHKEYNGQKDVIVCKQPFKGDTTISCYILRSYGKYINWIPTSQESNGLESSVNFEKIGNRFVKLFMDGVDLSVSTKAALFGNKIYYVDTEIHSIDPEGPNFFPSREAAENFCKMYEITRTSGTGTSPIHTIEYFPEYLGQKDVIIAGENAYALVANGIYKKAQLDARGNPLKWSTVIGDVKEFDRLLTCYSAFGDIGKSFVGDLTNSTVNNSNHQQIRLADQTPTKTLYYDRLSVDGYTSWWNILPAIISGSGAAKIRFYEDCETSRGEKLENIISVSNRMLTKTNDCCFSLQNNKCFLVINNRGIIEYVECPDVSFLYDMMKKAGVYIPDEIDRGVSRR